MISVLLFACVAPPGPSSPRRVPQVPRPGPPYAERISAIADHRAMLAALDIDHADAQASLDAAILELVDAWKGTSWAFSGTAREPGAGPIACGHFVAGVLHDAGLQVERTRLGQQASEQIIRTLTSEQSIRRYRRERVATVVAGVRADGDGVYVVGLDSHVGFLVGDAGEVWFCHSSRVAGVVCEEALASPSLPSRYTVVGKLGEQALVDAWLEGTPLPTVAR